jgi:hypothetical protein
LTKYSAVPPGCAARPEGGSSVAPRLTAWVLPASAPSERASHPGDEQHSAKPSRLLLVTIGAAFVVAVAPQAAVAQPLVVSLPWPPAVLPKTPPLAPSTAGVLPLSRFLGKLACRERVIVGLAGDGTPHSVRALQTIVIKQLGNYVFAVPAPVRSVLPGPGTESPPGRRENQILWQGFSPGHRLLAAWADLRPAESVGALPLRVRVTTEVAGSRLGPGEKRSGDLRVTLTAENATTAQAESFTAEPDPAELALVLGRIRSAIRRDVFAEGLNIRLRSSMTPVAVRVAAPLRLDGTLTFAPGTVQLRGARGGVVRISGLLDGRRRSRLRLVLRGRATNASAPNLKLRVRTAEIPDPVTPSQDPRTRLAGTIALELAYARKRQYDMFLASPEQTGPSSTTYVYKTTAALRTATPAAGSGGGGGDHTVGWIVLGLVLAAGVPAAAVIWAHS